LEALRVKDVLYHQGTAVLEDILGAVSLPLRSLVVIADSQAQAVHIGGDPQAVTAVAEANIVPGSSVGESAIGTNIVSLACQTGQPSILYCAEHYYESLQRWQSCAVPIPHPQTGRLVGVMTLCSFEQYDWHAVFRVLFQAAKLISLLIDNEEKSRRCLLLERHQAQQMQYTNDAILTVDSAGVIQALSPAFAYLSRSMSLPHMLGTSLSAVGLEIREFADLTTVPSEVEIRFLNKERGHKASVVPVRDPKRAKLIGYMLTVPLAKMSGSQPRAITPAAKISSDQKGHTFDTLMGTASSFLQTVTLARRAASCDDTVLLTGESGTGKELLAHAIHHASTRRHGPFVAVNCAGGSEDLIASELFGYTAGAFTGALRGGKRGKFELASLGTLFLDEVGDMPLKMQQALLRVLEEQIVTPLGAERSRPVDVRIIAASNANLIDRVGAGRFRLDLFHRLNVLPLLLPPLRERKQDIPLLIEHFLSAVERPLVIAPETMDHLLAYPWPGNIRELKTLIVRWVRLAPHDVITPADLPYEMRCLVGGRESLRTLRKAMEKESILEALQKTGGSVSQAAMFLGVSRVTLYRKMKLYHLASAHDRTVQAGAAD
jgi:sigma-54 dependent transcriptional regulator, acetoin dehydrogenase operon transcriptional activator AcoR